MADPFLGEIRMMTFGFNPKYWALCNGQLLSIAQYTALFSLLGTTYGGNGSTNFGLPNLQGRTPIHAGKGHMPGEAAGTASHTLTVHEMPKHPHTVFGTSLDASTFVPTGNVLARGKAGTNPLNYYEITGANLTTMMNQEVGLTGGGQPHENRQPYLALNFCIALQGVYPSRT